MGKVYITAGDPEFQKELTESEWDFIKRGDNWIGKSMRETKLKALHRLGWKLDEVLARPYEEQDRIWEEAVICWNNQSWERSKFKK